VDIVDSPRLFVNAPLSKEATSSTENRLHRPASQGSAEDITEHRHVIATWPAVMGKSKQKIAYPKGSRDNDSVGAPGGAVG
jgi:hypothetical protein